MVVAAAFGPTTWTKNRLLLLVVADIVTKAEQEFGFRVFVDGNRNSRIDENSIVSNYGIRIIIQCV